MKSALSRGSIIAGAVLCVSTTLAFTTRASAFDIEGMIGTAIAMKMQMDALHYSRGMTYGGGHVRSRVASRHERDDSSGSSSSGAERDARDAEVVDRGSSKVAEHREPLDRRSEFTAQASERDASAMGGPTFSPSR
jgi:hypothetical protein